MLEPFSVITIFLFYIWMLIGENSRYLYHNSEFKGDLHPTMFRLMTLVIIFGVWIVLCAVMQNTK